MSKMFLYSLYTSRTVFHQLVNARYIFYSCFANAPCPSEYETESIILSITINKRWHKLNENILFHPFASSPIYRKIICFDMAFWRWRASDELVRSPSSSASATQCFYFFHNFSHGEALNCRTYLLFVCLLCH